MSGPSLYPTFMVQPDAGGGSGDAFIYVDGLNLVAANLAVTLAVEGPVKLLVLPEDDDETIVPQNTVTLVSTGPTRLET